MHLFVYGVLCAGLGDWPFLAGLRPGRTAHTLGALFAISDPFGWYPALRQGQGDGGAQVVGAVHEAGRLDWAAVDAFEGADYTRRPISVQVAGATIIAEAYVWTAPLPHGALRISHGDFARWLTETGRLPYAGP